MTFFKFKLFAALEKGKFMAAFPKFVESWNAFAKTWNALSLDKSSGLRIEKKSENKITISAQYV